jgi:hypothetical protein
MRPCLFLRSFSETDLKVRCRICSRNHRLFRLIFCRSVFLPVRLVHGRPRKLHGPAEALLQIRPFVGTTKQARNIKPTFQAGPEGKWERYFWSCHVFQYERWRNLWQFGSTLMWHSMLAANRERERWRNLWQFGSTLMWHSMLATNREREVKELMTIWVHIDVAFHVGNQSTSYLNGFAMIRGLATCL